MQLPPDKRLANAGILWTTLYQLLVEQRAKFIHWLADAVGRARCVVHKLFFTFNRAASGGVSTKYLTLFHQSAHTLLAAELAGAPRLEIRE